MIIMSTIRVMMATLLGAVFASQQEFTELRMPQVAVEKGETYLCHALPLDSHREHWITGFEPHSSMHTAHHMLLFGCNEPATDAQVWECGEMQGGGDTSQYPHADVCGSKQEILYAWARDAKALTLPEGVGFMVGGSSDTQYLVLQVHYMHPIPAEQPDSSGISLISTDQPMPRRAQTMLLATDGTIKAHSQENFEVACAIDEPVILRPFAFRVHAHARGRVVSGWRVRKQANGEHDWHLIGKEDPMHPEMFYPVANASMSIEEGDVLAARCHMRNDQSHDIHVGATGEDEMCNFYIMYWVSGNQVLDQNQCMSPGPPSYYWGSSGGLTNIPDKAANNL